MSSKTRQEIGKTVTGQEIVKVLTGERGRPSYEVKVGEGDYMPYKTWLTRNGQPLIPFKPYDKTTARLAEVTA